jgi:hypothetical protein
MSDTYPPVKPTLRRIALLCLLAGVLVAGLLFPIVGGVGVASNHASESVAQGSADILGGEVPAISTMVDVDGNPIAWLYLPIVLCGITDALQAAGEIWIAATRSGPLPSADEGRVE